jgi:HK97 family phage portal protein
MKIFRWPGWFSSYWNKEIVNPDLGEQLPGPGSQTTSSGITVSDEDALKISSVWACVQLITDSVSGIPLRWYRVSGDQRKALEDSHFLSRLWRNRPNSYMKMRDFRRSMTFQLALWNNAYAKIDYGVNGDVVALTPMHPARMRVFRDSMGLTYHYHGDKEIFVFSDQSVLHLKGMGPDGVIGLNRSDYGSDAYGLAKSADTYAAKQFANGGRPPGVLKTDQFLKPEQREALGKIYEGITATAENANKLWVLEGGTTYEMLAHDPNTMQMIESRIHQAGSIAQFFGVPAILIGANGTSTSAWPASFENQQLAFLTYTLNSYLDEWEEALADALVPSGQRGKVICDHDEDDFIKMDSQAKAAFLSTNAQNGLMTRNEGRAKLRLPRIEGGDELTAQVNLLPLNKLGEDNDSDTASDEQRV